MGGDRVAASPDLQNQQPGSCPVQSLAERSFNFSESEISQIALQITSHRGFEGHKGWKAVHSSSGSRFICTHFEDCEACWLRLKGNRA